MIDYEDAHAVEDIDDIGFSHDAMAGNGHVAGHPGDEVIVISSDEGEIEPAEVEKDVIESLNENSEENSEESDANSDDIDGEDEIISFGSSSTEDDDGGNVAIGPQLPIAGLQGGSTITA